MTRCLALDLQEAEAETGAALLPYVRPHLGTQFETALLEAIELVGPLDARHVEGQRQMVPSDPRIPDVQQIARPSAEIGEAGHENVAPGHVDGAQSGPDGEPVFIADLVADVGHGEGQLSDADGDGHPLPVLETRDLQRAEDIQVVQALEIRRQLGD